MDAMTVVKLLWFFLPAYIANMAPVLGRFLLRPLAVPIDGGLSWRGTRLLGDHKTWRGLVLGIAGGIVTSALQVRFGPESWALAPVDSWLELGVLLGFGALFGDMVKSFVKRRVGIEPGARWIPFDQLDFIVGALVFGSLIYFPGWFESVVLAAVSFVLYIVVNEAGYRLGLRGSKW